MPSILFINRVYPPSKGATGRVLEYVAEGFVKAGWCVSVLATVDGEKRNPPDGHVTRNGVAIYTVGVFRMSKSNILKRLSGYVFMIPSLLFRAMVIPRSDVVVTMTDPPMLLSMGFLIGFFKKSRLIHWAQDLYPEVAEELGVLSPGGMPANVLRFISTFAMRYHVMTVVPGRCMKKRLVRRGISDSRIRVLPNTGMEQKIQPRPSFPNSFRASQGLGEYFVVEYSGNMGLAHEFETIIEAAAILQQMGHDDILFLFIGSGPREKSVRGEVRRRGLENVRFLAAQPEETLQESLAAGDLHLVTMREGLSGLVVPSKLYGVMAASRPCIFIGPADSEVSYEIIESGAGAIVSPGNARNLTEKILEYRNSPLQRAESGKRGHDWVRKRNSLETFLGSVNELLGM